MYYSIGNTAYLSIDTEITEWVALQFKEEMDYAEADPSVENIEISINSIGGNVIYGYTIFSSIIKSNKNTITINTGACYSMASICFLAGKERKAFDYSILLIHNPFYSDGAGNADYLMLIQQSLTTILSHTFEDLNQLTEWMNSDKTFTAQQLLEMGVIDEVIPSNIKVKISEGNTAEEIYNIMNKVIKNNNSQMKEEIKNEVVEAVPTVEETKVEAVEAIEKVEEVEEENEFKNTLNEMKEAFKLMQTENETLKEQIKNLTIEKVEAEKVEVLNSVGIKDVDSWMKLEISEIKNLIKSVPTTKSPKISTTLLNKGTIKATLDDYSAEELMNLAETDEATYLELFKNTEAKRNQSK